MELIDIDRQHSLISLLETLKASKSMIRVWQSIKKTHDYSYGVIVGINSLNCTIRIKLRSSEVSSFDNNQEIYFHSSNRDLIFKSKIKKIDRDFLEISIPRVVKLQEARVEKRTNLGIQGNQYAKVSFINECKEKLESKFRVLDFSPNGLALMVNKFIFEGIAIDDKVVVEKLSSEGKLDKRVYIIRNKGNITNKIGSTKEFRVGLEACR